MPVSDRAASSVEPTVRALVLSANIGESHAQMANTLGAELEQRDDVESVAVLIGFDVLGPALDRALSRGYRFHLGQVQWSYNLAYWLFTRLALAREAAEWTLYGLGGTALERTIERHRPDVVISTHPVINPVLGHLRAADRIDCPVAAVVGPLGGHDFWVQPRLDLHLINYPEAFPSVARLAKGARIRSIRPLVRPQFFEPGFPEEIRAEFAIPPHAPLALLSGGGWGAGDLDGALEACLGVQGLYVIAVCGRNEPLRDRLAFGYRDEERVSVVGFTARMRDLLWAADALITATAGSSCVEARLCGCPIIVYGFPVGHVRDNARALVHHRLARSATSLASLREAILAVLREGRNAIPSLSELPSAAESIVTLARSQHKRGTPGRVGSMRGQRYVTEGGAIGAAASEPAGGLREGGRSR